jgi:hypothetical protein
MVADYKNSNTYTGTIHALIITAPEFKVEWRYSKSSSISFGKIIFPIVGEILRLPDL